MLGYEILEKPILIQVCSEVGENYPQYEFVREYVNSVQAYVEVGNPQYNFIRGIQDSDENHPVIPNLP